MADPEFVCEDCGRRHAVCSCPPPKPEPLTDSELADWLDLEYFVLPKHKKQEPKMYPATSRDTVASRIANLSSASTAAAFKQIEEALKNVTNLPAHIYFGSQLGIALSEAIRKTYTAVGWNVSFKTLPQGVNEPDEDVLVLS